MWLELSYNSLIDMVLLKTLQALLILAMKKKALFIINSVVADLALLKTPREWGADIAIGDIQSLGLPMAFGGPYAGYMCSTES